MVTGTPTSLDAARRARRVAEQVPDPELPMLTLADLGVLRDVRVGGDGTVVASLTPTYSGCPAMAEMRADVAARLREAGYPRVEIRTVLDPPWTSDWITEAGRRKLAEHGISCAGKTARRMSAADYAEFDLLIGMDDANLRNMRRICGGDADGKLHKLTEYCGRPDAEVADPWYTGDFEATWQDVLEGCTALLEELR